MSLLAASEPVPKAKHSTQPSTTLQGLDSPGKISQCCPGGRQACAIGLLIDLANILWFQGFCILLYLAYIPIYFIKEGDKKFFQEMYVALRRQTKYNTNP